MRKTLVDPKEFTQSGFTSPAEEYTRTQNLAAIKIAVKAPNIKANPTASVIKYFN